MVCVQGSISHRADSHSPRHHWQWRISYSEWPLELSTSLVSHRHGTRSMSHQLGHVTFQSLQPDLNLHNEKSYVIKINYAHTLQMLSCETRIFLAARSLWINPFPERYCIPRATCWEKLRSISGSPAIESSPGLLTYYTLIIFMIAKVIAT